MIRMTLRINARFISLGGGVLAALAVFLLALAAGSYWSPHVSAVERLVLSALFLLLVIYFAVSLVEKLSFDGRNLDFQTWRGSRAVDVSKINEILLVHEGLNLEHGIESLIFRDRAGDVITRFDLGPLWRRTDLEPFLHRMEEALGRTKLVQEVR
jgi:hypothetical protein